MRKLFLYIVSSALLLTACTTQFERKAIAEYPGAVILHLKNTLPIERPDAFVPIPLEMLQAKAADFNPRAILLLVKGHEIPAQLDDQDGDGTPDRILTSLNIPANATLPLTVRYAQSGTRERIYPQRTQAELSVRFGGKWENRKYIGGVFHNVDALRVPPEHTDHSEYIRYEGPGWESDKVGYRFYLDWRNAIDIYGKKTNALVLQNVGQDGFESYHNMAEWGMDILKVGDALGIGSIAWWDGQKANRVAVTDSVYCRIAAVGPLLSRIRTDYYGWKIGDRSIDLHSTLSISAGSHITRHTLRIDGESDNLCTGLVKLPNTEMIPPPSAGEYSWLATWGVQSLNNDQLGMAIIYRRADLILQTEDANSHVVVLRPEKGVLRYRFLAAWELEPGGVTSSAAFTEELDNIVIKLNNPIVIE
jgi:hypothetical protein